MTDIITLLCYRATVKLVYNCKAGSNFSENSNFEYKLNVSKES